MKKVILANTNAGRFVATVKDDQAIVFTDYDLNKLGIDVYDDEQFNPADFDFDAVIDNNTDVEIIDAASLGDYDVLKSVVI